MYTDDSDPWTDASATAAGPPADVLLDRPIDSDPLGDSAVGAAS
jgi:hypothetical protein